MGVGIVAKYSAAVRVFVIGGAAVVDVHDANARVKIAKVVRGFM